MPGCRYGGHPLVPPGTQWPHSPRGPLSFVGQLDFAELAACRAEALPNLPRDGVLALFYDVQEQPWGFDPKDGASSKLLWTPRSSEAVALAPPRELEEAGLAFDLPLKLTPRPGLSLPDPWDRRATLPVDDWGQDAADDYTVLRERLTGGEHSHQVGGHPWWIQSDARLEAQLVTHGLYCGDSRGYDSPRPGGWSPAPTTGACCGRSAPTTRPASCGEIWATCTSSSGTRTYVPAGSSGPGWASSVGRLPATYVYLLAPRAAPCIWPTAYMRCRLSTSAVEGESLMAMESTAPDSDERMLT